MMIGLGATPCITWNQQDFSDAVLAQMDNCNSLGDPISVAECQVRVQGAYGAMAPYIAKTLVNGCIASGYLSNVPSGYAASHMQALAPIAAPAPPPPIPVVIPSTPAPATYTIMSNPPIPVPAATPVTAPPPAAPAGGTIPGSNTAATMVQNPMTSTSGSSSISSAIPQSSSTSTSIIPGVPDNYLYIGGAAVVLLMLMGGKK